MLMVGIIALGAGIVLMVFLVGDKRFAGSQAVEASGEVGGLPSSVIPRPRTSDPSEPLPSVYRRFAAFARRLTPANYGRNLQRKLDLAGNPRNWSADRVLAFKGMGLVIGAVLGALLGAKHGALVLVGVLVGAAVGFFLPDVWVRNLGEHRQLEIVRGLPDAVDMMTVCVEAGLGFDAALARVALNLEGSTASEFARVLQEMQFGKSRADALRALVDRTNVPELRSFVSALLQSAELGISVGDVLREQSREMRLKRRQRAEEKAQKLPVKILLPLLTCLLPAMFVVVLGPAIINIVHTFGHLTGK